MSKLFKFNRPKQRRPKKKPLTSGGIPRDHMAIPAPPPAVMIAGTLKGGAGALVPSGKVSGVADNIFLRYSYVAKYAALPGPSRASVAIVPRKRERIPPSA